MVKSLQSCHINFGYQGLMEYKGQGRKVLELHVCLTKTWRNSLPKQTTYVGLEALWEIILSNHIHEFFRKY